MATLHQAFDLAWQRVLDEGFHGEPSKLLEAQRLLPTCIMAHARPGQLKLDDMIEACA
jgi:hypothetical protein